MSHGKFVLFIETGNAAFEDRLEQELARILRDVARRVESGALNGPCKDWNGNRVGNYNHDLDQD